MKLKKEWLLNDGEGENEVTNPLETQESNGDEPEAENPDDGHPLKNT
jgi:hypothetical protein